MTYVDSPTVISLFSGAGMLDAAIRVVLPGARTVCFVEREVPAAAILASRMADGGLHEAPVWSDVTSFDGSAWRGLVDGIVGGFPCQDLSVAGRQEGIHGKRSGLFFEYVRIIREVQPRWVLVENVPPVLAFPAGGTVLGELAALGFDAEWRTIRASDIGAPHRRERAFILAYRAGGGLGKLWQSPWSGGLADWGDEELGDAEREGHAQSGEPGRGAKPAQAGAGVDDRPERSGGVVDDATGARCRGRQPGESGAIRDGARRQEPCGRCDGMGAGVGLADSHCEGLEERGGQSSHARSLQPTSRAIPSSVHLPLFPPGPSDADGWQRILAERPDLAPAVESSVRGLADVSAPRVDRLRAGGNGVVVLQAAAVFVDLARRAGLMR